MNNKKEIKLGYDDVAIVPEVVTTISSRSECSPYDEDGFLPIFASCMSSVVSIENAKDFNNAKIRTVIPRDISIDERMDYMFSQANGFGTNCNFVSFSLNEIKEYFLGKIFVTEGRKYYKSFNVCIDLANGHMQEVIDAVKMLKDRYGNGICIMTGNIANPETYREYEKAGLDFIRCGIGGGNACLTSSNLGLHYSLFSLMEEVYKVKKEINGKCKIIADGGIHGYRDIQKALIYADYVMIGSLFNKAMESNGKTTYGTFYWNIRGKKIVRPIKTLLYYGREIPKSKYEKCYSMLKNGKLTIWKQFFGQSTKLAQSLINAANKLQSKLKTSEGLIKYQKVEYDIHGWAENETDYLKSAMSYTNSRTLDEYKDSQWIRISKIDYNK